MRRTTDDYEKETSAVIKHHLAVYRGLRTNRRHYDGRRAVPGAELRAEQHISADGNSYTDTDLGSHAHDNSHPGTDPGSHAHDNSYTYADLGSYADDNSYTGADLSSHAHSYFGSHA